MRKHHCHACAYLRLGVKTRVMPAHTCGIVSRVSNGPENAENNTQTGPFLQQNPAQIANITAGKMAETIANIDHTQKLT